MLAVVKITRSNATLRGILSTIPKFLNNEPCNYGSDDPAKGCSNYPPAPSFCNSLLLRVFWETEKRKGESRVCFSARPITFMLECSMQIRVIPRVKT